VGQAGSPTCTISDGAGTQTLQLLVDAAFVRIASGETTSLTDNGFLYVADEDFSTSSTFCTTATVPPSRRCVRFSNAPNTLVYTIPVPTSGGYNVTLQLGEIWTGITGPGQRVFNAAVNGETISNIDPFAIAGLNGIADQTFSVVATNNQIVCTLTSVVQNPDIQALVIVPLASTPTSAPTSAPTSTPSGTPPVFTSTPPTTPAVPFSTWTYTPVATGATSFSLASGSSTLASISSTTGQVSVTPLAAQAGLTISFTIVASNSAGTVSQAVVVSVDSALLRVNVGSTTTLVSGTEFWAADTNTSQGQVWTNTSAITNNATIPNAICINQRWVAAGSNLVYSFTAPVAGDYTVLIIACETFNGAMAPGERQFNILVQGVTIATNFDLFATSGTNAGVVSTVVATTSASETIQIVETHGGANNPVLGAIVILFGGVPGTQPPATTPPATTTPPPTTSPPTLAPGSCPSPFVLNGSNCVSTNTGCSAFNNMWDCVQGCVNPALNVVFNICQGGTCSNGVCVPHTLTTTDVTNIEAIVEAFITAQEALEVATANLVGPQPGDCVGGLVRAAFHSCSTLTANACLFVAPCTNCEFNATHNNGLQVVVLELRALYNSNNLWEIITLTDFVYLAVTQAVIHASQGAIVPTYQWGRTQCPCMTTFPVQTCSGLVLIPDANMPGAEDSLATITTIMETNFGFNDSEWRCLIAAHALGRAMPNNTGYARHWTTTPNVLDNSYAVELTNGGIDWNPEVGVANPGFTEPILGNTQYSVVGAARGTGTLMLKSDIRAFWDADPPDNNCFVNRTTGGCPPLAQLSLLNTWAASPASFNACFQEAFTKMINLRQPNLKAPVAGPA